MVENLMDLYRDNLEALEVIRLVEHTRDSIFLTGKAGTGKSTLLRNITQNINKNFIVIAPTGIAAINVNGQTIHSFFRIAPRPYLPEDKDIEYLESKHEVLQNLDLIIIDEVSMVRADLMNAIDLSLRKNLNSPKPFAGIQILMIGDLFQLPPILNSNNLNEVEIVYSNYKTLYFFSSKSFEKGLPYHVVELQKVYRQTDRNFIDLLNSVRENTISNQDLINLNSRYNPSYEPAQESNEITLATTNPIVDEINSEKLNAIEYETFTFIAQTTGTFNESKNKSKFPTEKTLSLKKSAQIMFIKNDSNEQKRWVNGTMGKVISINEDEITVLLSKTNSTYKIEKSTWEDVEYVWNKKEGKIEQKVVGTFTQFPLKLAWAVTIHKSQGQTFDKTIINLGSGAFSTGQTYVALSRCTTFKGITLKTKIRKSDIKVDTVVQSFLNSKQTSEMENLKYNSIINGLELSLKSHLDQMKNILTEKQKLSEYIKLLEKKDQQSVKDLSIYNSNIDELKEKNRRLDYEITKFKTEIAKIESNLNIKIEENAILNSSVKELIQSKNKSTNTNLIWFLFLSLAILLSFLLYKEIYLPRQQLNYVNQINETFSDYLKSLPVTGCEKENIGARSVLINDLNNDGNIDGIVIATFDGVSCKNSSETVLFVYDVKNILVSPPLRMTLTSKNRSILSLRGIEDGKLVFDKWNTKDYDQKKYNSQKIEKSHYRMYIDIQGDTLNLNIKNY